MQGRCRAPLAAGPPPARPKCTLHAEAHHRRPLCCPVRPTQIWPDPPCLQTHRNAVVSALGLPLRPPMRPGPLGPIGWVQVRCSKGLNAVEGNPRSFACRPRDSDREVHDSRLCARLTGTTAHDSLGTTGHHCHGSCAEARGVRLRRGTGQVVAGGDTAPGPLDVLDG